MPTLLPSAWMTTPQCACGLPHPNPTPDAALPNITMLKAAQLTMPRGPAEGDTPALSVIVLLMTENSAIKQTDRISTDFLMHNHLYT